MKLLSISKCSECKYCLFDGAEKEQWGNHWCQEMNKQVNPDVIPEECPLEDIFDSDPQTPAVSTEALKTACQNFVNKVEAGKAKSTESYNEMKKALAMVEGASEVESVTVDFDGNEYALQKKGVKRYNEWKEKAESKIPGMDWMKAIATLSDASNKGELNSDLCPECGEDTSKPGGVQ